MSADSLAASQGQKAQLTQRRKDFAAILPYLYQLRGHQALWQAVTVNATALGYELTDIQAELESAKCQLCLFVCLLECWDTTFPINAAHILICKTCQSGCRAHYVSNILIELHGGSLGPTKLHASPQKTAESVLDACTCKFGRGDGTLSPKDKPNLILIDNDVISGGVTYVFTPVCRVGGY